VYDNRSCGAEGRLGAQLRARLAKACSYAGGELAMTRPYTAVTVSGSASPSFPGAARCPSKVCSVRHSYGWTGGVKPPFSLLVRSGGGNWDFTETEGGTRIVWTYTFDLTSPLAYPLAMPILWLFKSWLQQGLDAIRAELLS